MLAVSLFSAGCGASKQRQPFLFLVRDPVENASRRLHSAHEEASIAVSALKEVGVDTRYNPASCACPAWEVFVFGRWTRVSLDPEPPRDLRRVRRMFITPTDRSEGSRTGWNYPVMNWRIGPELRSTSAGN